MGEAGTPAALLRGACVDSGQLCQRAKNLAELLIAKDELRLAALPYPRPGAPRHAHQPWPYGCGRQRGEPGHCGKRKTRRSPGFSVVEGDRP